MTSSGRRRPSRSARVQLIVWLALAATCAIAAGLDVFLAASMSELWPLIVAAWALLAAAACGWAAVDELRRTRFPPAASDALIDSDPAG